MPLPFILGAIAATAAIGGVGSGIQGAAKMKETNDTMKSADSRHKANIKRFDDTSAATNKVMDELGANKCSCFGKKNITAGTCNF